MKRLLIVLLTSLSLISFGQPTKSNSIKVLSWNIFMLPKVAAKSSPWLRALAIGQLLSVRNYDVIVFQEAFSAKSRQIIFEQLRMLYPYAVGPANQKLISGKTNSGIWILSKYPVLRSQSTCFKAREGADALSRKGALMAEINFKGIIVQIIGTHLQSAGDSGIRELQCEQIFREILLPNQNDSIAQIICGDMNIDRYSSPKAYAAMVHSLRAKNGEMIINPSFSFDPSSNDVCKDLNQKAKLIDYVLIGNNGFGTTFVQGRVISLKKQWSVDHQDLSDHYSVEAEIGLDQFVTKSATNNRYLVQEFNEPKKQGRKVNLRSEYFRLFAHGFRESAIGLSATISVTPRWKLGVGTYLNLNSIRSEYKDGALDYGGSVKLVGLKVDYSVYRNTFINISIPTLVGIGSISMNNVPLNSNSSTDRLVIGQGKFIRPSLNMDMKLTNHIAASVGAGCLWFTDNDSRADYNKAIFSISTGLNIKVFNAIRSK